MAFEFSLVCSTTAGFAQGTDHFTINIPKKTAAPFLPMGEVKAVVALSNPLTGVAGSGPVTFTFKDESVSSPTISIVCSATACVPSVPATICDAVNFPTSVCFNDNTINEPGSRGPDIVTVTSTTGPASDPVRFEIDFLLQSNLAPNSCTVTQQV